MKLVIQTQIRENYGAHDWDGEGECPQYWKCKGGNTYVVRYLSDANVNPIVENGFPNLTTLITENNDYYKEHIIDWEIVGVDEVRWEKWETPIILEFCKEQGWVVTRRTINDPEYGYMRSDIACKTEAWIILEGNTRKEGSYECFYEMKNGRILSYEELEQYWRQCNYRLPFIEKYVL